MSKSQKDFKRHEVRLYKIIPGYGVFLISPRKHVRKHLTPIYCPSILCDQKRAERRDMIRHITTGHYKWAEQSGLQVEGLICPNCGKESGRGGRSDNFKRHIKDCNGGSGLGSA